MAQSLGEACLDLCTDNEQANRGIDETGRKAEGLDATFKRVGRNISGFGDTLTTRLSAPLALAAGGAFKLGADAAEAGNKLDVVMGGAADRVRTELAALEATIPLTTGEFHGLAAGVQDMLVPMGLARAAGAQMSVQMIELAGDIAAFNNTTPAQVIDDMKSALAGSSEPLFKYGVDTRVAALESVALANGLIEQGEALDNAARAQAVLLQIQNQSTDAMGAAAREAGGAAQSTQFLWREVKQLGEEVGQVLIPIFVPMINGLRDAVTWFRELEPATQAIIVKVGLLAATIGPLLSITGRLVTAFGVVHGAMVAKTVATAADTAATVANTAAQAAQAAAVPGLIATQASRTAAITAATTATGANTAANATNLTSLGKLTVGLGKATAALGAFWVGWEAGKVVKDAIGIDDDWFAGLLDNLGVYGESIQEIRADVNEAAVAHGEYRTAAQIATDEAERQAAAIAGDVVPAWADYGTTVEEVKKKLVPVPPVFVDLDTAVGDLTRSFRAALPAATEFARAYTATGDSLLLALPAFVDTNEVATEFATMTLPETAKELEATTTPLDSFFESFKTGNDLIDSALGSLSGFISDGLGKLVGALGGGKGGGGIGDLFGNLFGGGKDGEAGSGGIGGMLNNLLGGLFGGAGGGTDGIGSLLGSLAGPLGGLLGGLVGKGVGALVGVFKNLFGGPSELELAGREAAASYRTGVLASMSDASQSEIAAAVAQGWTEAGARAVTGLRDVVMAYGGTAQQALSLSDQLWKAEKEGPEAVEAVIAKIAPMMDAVNAAMQSTGLSLTDLRNMAINAANVMGTSVAEAFQNIADGTITSMADAHAAATGIVQQASDAQIEAARRTVEDTKLAIAELEMEYKQGFQSVLHEEGLTTAERTAMLAQMTKEYESQLANYTKQHADAMAIISGTQSTTFGDMVIDAQDTNTRIQAAFEATTSTAGGLFENLREAWSDTMGDMIDDAGELSHELVGNSIWVDMVDAMVSQARRVGAAGEEQADRFRRAMEGDGGFRFRPRATGGDGDSEVDFIPRGRGDRGGRGGGGNQVVHLKLTLTDSDGKRFARFFVKHFDKVLADAGVG